MNGNSLMGVPEHLDKLSKRMEDSVRRYLTTTDTILKDKKIYEAISEDGAEQIFALQLLRKGLAQDSSGSVYVAMASDPGSGKSTLMNAIVGYPLLPAAMTATTACATEIHYGTSPSLQIQYYARPEGNAFEAGGPAFDENHVLGNDIWRQLLDFAILCVRERIIYAGTLQYHASRNLNDPDITWKDLGMSAKDPRHVVQLLLILFTTYVGQNDPNPSERIAKVCTEREKLIRILGVNPDRDYAVRVRWEHPALKQGLVIVDLPGLSAYVPELAAPDRTVRRSHERISVDYLQIVDSIFLLFDPSALASGASKILETVLASEQMKHIVSKENRIIPILNKVDLPGAEQAIPRSTNQIRRILGNLNPPYVYPMSALSGEYRFVENGITPIGRTQAYLRSHEKVRQDFRNFLRVEPTQEQIENKVYSDLKDAYETSYQFTDVNGVPCSITLEQWIRMMTTDYVSRIQTLKVIELLRMGMQANEAIIQMAKMRIVMLEMLNGEDEKLTKALLSSLIYAGMSSLEDFQRQFGDVQGNLRHRIAESVLQGCGKIRTSCMQALDTVERELATLIGTQVNRMQPNVFGNMLLNPNAALLPGAQRAALHNRLMLEELTTKLENYSVRNRLKASEQLISATVSEVQKIYKASLTELYEMYDRLIANISDSMDKAYEQSKTASKSPVFYETISGVRYRQLKDSLLKEMEQNVIIIKDMLVKDERMDKVPKAAIDAVTSVSIDLEERYRNKCAAYICGMEVKTIAGNPTFNWNQFLATLQQPFFTAVEREKVAEKLICIFACDYATSISDVVRQIQIELVTLNFTGLQEPVNRLASSVKQKPVQDRQTLDNEIVNLRFYSDYICKQMKKLMDEIGGAWGILHDCAWAANELNDVGTIYENLFAAAK